MLGWEKVLYDPVHQPHAPTGWFFRALLALAALMRSFGALLATITSAKLLGFPLAKLHEWIPMPRRLGQGLIQALPDAVMALIVSWLLLKFAHRARLSELGLAWSSGLTREVALAAFGGAASIGLITIPLLLAGFGEAQPAESKIRGVYGLSVLLLLLAISAFSEELMVRGYAFQTLVYPVHLLGAVILTNGAFAARHIVNRGANEYTLANTFLAGCVLSILLVWRRSLWVVTAAHFGWNLGTILLGLNVSGITVPLVPFRIVWKIDPIWTGGNYGPEGGLICTFVLSLLLLILIRLHYHRKHSGQPAA